MSFNVQSKGGLKMRQHPDIGLLFCEHKYNSEKFAVFASVDTYNGVEMEHVSVSLKSRTPSWDALNFFRLQFWDAGDEVFLVFPTFPALAAGRHVVHLWRRVDGLSPFELPTIKRTLQ